MNRSLSIPLAREVVHDEPSEAEALEALIADTAQHDSHDGFAPRVRPSLPGVVIGTLVGFLENGEPLVRLPGDDELPHAARSTVPIDVPRVGAEVVLAFESGKTEKPIILGLLEAAARPASPTAAPIAVAVDDERVELTAEREIVLRCGKASITLTRAGKVIIRGAYLLSRSSGVNRIKGGSVQIN